MILDFLFFMIRHTPFWSIPIIFIFGQFGYIYWLKGLIPAFFLFMIICFVSSLFLIFYIWEGGPENAALAFLDMVRILI